MADGSAILGLFSSFKSITDITKALVTLRDGQMIQAKVIELQQVILAAQNSAIQAQAELTELAAEVRELKGKLARLNDWERDKSRYEMLQLYRGPFAYVLKREYAAAEAAHALCPSCFERGTKSPLQSSGHADVHEHFWHCPSCKTKTLSQWREMKPLIEKTREHLAAS